jgi:hypothetical protein
MLATVLNLPQSFATLQAGPTFDPCLPCCAPDVPAVQFKDHLKKSEAQSEFAKTKSMAEQRRFLPVYGVREEMMQVGTGCSASWSLLPPVARRWQPEPTSVSSAILVIGMRTAYPAVLTLPACPPAHPRPLLACRSFARTRLLLWWERPGQARPRR